MNRSIAALLLLVPALVVAHQGDRVLVIPELTDAQVSMLDVHDGSTSDWLALVGEPVATLGDFALLMFDEAATITVGDPSATGQDDLDVRVWLAWHDASDRIFAALERADDVYANTYSIAGQCGHSMQYMDSGIGIAIDGDHSGGDYWFANTAGVRDEVWVRDLQQTAQSYMAIAETVDGTPKLRSGSLDSQIGRWWYVQPPWADAGGSRTVDQPATTTTELFVTAFNSLDPYEDGVAQIADLRPNDIIGVNLRLGDSDLGPIEQRPCLAEEYYELPRQDFRQSGDKMVDGLLLPAGSMPPGAGSLVTATTWARIKFSLVDGSGDR